jgi:glycosyltransferase involved in cell wall biosynthesis
MEQSWIGGSARRRRPRHIGEPVTPRVLIVLPTLDGGGAERFNLELADSLRQQGLDCAIFCVNRRGPLLREVAERDVPVEFGSRYSGTATWRLALSVLVALPRLARAMRRADVTIAGMEGVVTILTAPLGRLMHTPVIAEVQTDLDAKFARPGVIWPLLAAASRAAYPLCGRVASISDGAAGWIARTGIHAPVVVVPMAVNTRRIEELAGDANPDRDVPTIVAVGRLTRQKGFDLLIRAHAQARPRAMHRLLILGEGEERSKLQALAAELGVGDTVLMPGFDPNPYRAMRSADALCLSSLYEGMPTVLVEALLLGCPVIATDCVAGVRDVLANGAHGALVPAGDVDALADALVQHLNDPSVLRDKAAAASPLVRKRHSYDAAAARYLELIGEVMGERAGPRSAAGVAGATP